MEEANSLQNRVYGDAARGAGERGVLRAEDRTAEEPPALRFRRDALRVRVGVGALERARGDLRRQLLRPAVRVFPRQRLGERRALARLRPRAGCG